MRSARWQRQRSTGSSSRAGDIPLSIPTSSARSRHGLWALHPNGAEVVVVWPDGALAGPPAEIAGELDRLRGDDLGELDRGVRRYQRVERLTGGFTAIWYDRFPGGCVTSRMHSTTDTNGTFANEAARLLGFITRAELGQTLSQRSGGRLELDVAAR